MLQLGKQDSEQPKNKQLEDTYITVSYFEVGQEPISHIEIPAHVLNSSRRRERLSSDLTSPTKVKSGNLDSPLTKKRQAEVILEEMRDDIPLDDIDNSSQGTTTSEHSRVTLSVFEYIRSFFSKDETLRKKREILAEGRRRIEERLDVFNVLKKMREIDKLKFLLLDKYQLALFENLPRPVLEEESRQLLRHTNTPISNLVQGTFVQQAKEREVEYAYRYLKQKEDKSLLDKKLLGIYEEFSAF